MKNPQFCIITPTAYLDRYASQSSMHLVLAHLVDTDDKYASFYAGRKEFKIMDNGAFELGESYEPNKLIDLARRCRADAVVLPDYPFQASSVTIEASKRLIDQVKAAGFKTMFVPQSEVGNVNDWVDCYEWAATNKDIDIIGMSILGIPNAIPNVHIGYARVVMTNMLIEMGIFNQTKYHHYLGLNAGPGLEIPTLINMGALDSCDSSGPVWAGICGHAYSKDYDSLQAVSKIKKHVDFDYSMVKDEATLCRIQHNINLTLELFKAPPKANGGPLC